MSVTPLPEPEHNDHVDVRFKRHNCYTEAQLKAYGAAEYARAIEDAAAEFDRRANLPDGTKLEGFYDPDEPAEIIRQLGAAS